MSKSAKHDKDEMIDHLEGAAESAGRCARKLIDEATCDGDALVDCIREKPVQSALVALGIGFLIGAIVRR